MQDYSFHKKCQFSWNFKQNSIDSGIGFFAVYRGKLADSTAEGKNYGLPLIMVQRLVAIRSTGGRSGRSYG